MNVGQPVIMQVDNSEAQEPTGQSYVSRALQINSSPQGWMARNTKPVPFAEKGWVITMKKIRIILLSALLVFSMAACNGGKEKADNKTENSGNGMGYCSRYLWNRKW